MKKRRKGKRGRPKGSKNKPKYTIEELIKIIPTKELKDLKLLEKEYVKKK